MADKKLSITGRYTQHGVNIIHIDIETSDEYKALIVFEQIYHSLRRDNAAISLSLIMNNSIIATR